MQFAQEVAHAKMARDLSHEVVKISMSFHKAKSCEKKVLSIVKVRLASDVVVLLA